ncbi:MAG: hypothetical protein R3A10_19140 [Caldilineaceae bacterium]
MIQVGLDPYDAMGGQIGIQDGFYPPCRGAGSGRSLRRVRLISDNDMMVQAFEITGEFYKIAVPTTWCGAPGGQGG